MTAYIDENLCVDKRTFEIFPQLLTLRAFRKAFDYSQKSRFEHRLCRFSVEQELDLRLRRESQQPTIPE
jgi:hypothetical protein